MDSLIKANVILGTYDHDRFKPFWMGQSAHSLLGYAHARQLGRHEAYLAAILFHGTTNDTSTFLEYLTRHRDHKAPLQDALQRASPKAIELVQALLRLFWWRTKAVTPQPLPSSLPKALLLANWIDRIASSGYSMFGEGDPDDFDGSQTISSQSASVSGSATSNPETYKIFEKNWKGTIQNPFSRLPVATHFPDGVKRVVVTTGTQLAERFQEVFTRTEIGGYNATSRKLKEAVKEQQEFDNVLIDIKKLTHAQKTMLRTTYPVFSERTYPHSNDTSLKLHTTLAANLFHVLLCNLQDGHPLAEMGLETLTDTDKAEIDQWLDKGQSTKILPTVVDLCSSAVVTVHLSGIEEHFCNAVRIDDLQGWKQLADRVRYALKQEVCASFGYDKADVAATDNTHIADLLAISDSQFELTYLWPFDQKTDVSFLQNTIQTLYWKALDRAVCSPTEPNVDGKSTLSLFDYLESDLHRAFENSNTTATPLVPDKNELIAGLKMMPVSISIQPVKPDKVTRLEDFGVALVKAYQAAHHMVMEGATSLDNMMTCVGPMIKALEAEIQESSDIAEQYNEPLALCSVTHAAPVWRQLSALAYPRENGTVVERLRDYFHDFRDEEDGLSQIGVAIRALGQGRTQLGTLDRMVKAKRNENGDGWSLDFPSDEKSIIKMPPLLQRRKNISAKDGLVNLNACYVRLRRDATNPDDALIRFPTVTYAADHNGNVAMLTLRGTDVIYDKQTFPQNLVDALDPTKTVPENYNGSLQAVEQLTTAYFNFDYLNKPATDKKRLLGELKSIPPHLARVLQRQQTITAFFERLPQRLEAAGIRVLPLETRFPIGRYLVPAESLADALDILDASLMLDLLAVDSSDLGLDKATCKDADVMAGNSTINLLDNLKRSNRDTRADVRKLLGAYVPSLLTGTTLVFKHKQALYLMLRAEERTNNHIKQIAPERGAVMRMALADLRSTLIDRTHDHGGYCFANWDDLSQIVRNVDRKSLDGLVYDWDQAMRVIEQDSDKYREPFQELIRARWTNRMSAADAKTRLMSKMLYLAKDDEHVADLRQAAHFILRAMHGNA